MTYIIFCIVVMLVAVFALWLDGIDIDAVALSFIAMISIIPGVNILGLIIMLILIIGSLFKDGVILKGRNKK